MDTLSVVTTVREVRVPEIGAFKDVPVIEVLVKTGDGVAKERPPEIRALLSSQVIRRCSCQTILRSTPASPM